MNTPYDLLHDLRETEQARRMAALARARRAQAKAAHSVTVAKDAACWELPEDTEIALWQVADAAKARTLIELHEAEETLRERTQELDAHTKAHSVAMRDEKMVARMKERFLEDKRMDARRREERDIDDFNATRHFQSIGSA